MNFDQFLIVLSFSIFLSFIFIVYTSHLLIGFVDFLYFWGSSWKPLFSDWRPPRKIFLIIIII